MKDLLDYSPRLLKERIAALEKENAELRGFEVTELLKENRGLHAEVERLRRLVGEAEGLFQRYKATCCYSNNCGDCVPCGSRAWLAKAKEPGDE